MNKKFAYAGSLLLVVLMTLFVGSCTGKSSITPDDQLIGQEETDGFVTEEEALLIAMDFIRNGNMDDDYTLRSSLVPSLNHVYSDGSGLRSGDAQVLPSYYVINLDSTGYVIVSASEVTYPVLAFSNESAFKPEDIPVPMADLLSTYSSEIREARRVIKPSADTEQMRIRALKGELEDLRSATYVRPLLGTIKWDQMPYYNQFCPTGTPVGCVATATSQIMRYWEHPARGTGSHVSTHDGQYANYDRVLNWNNMPRATLTTWNREVAQFCYDVAIGLNMQFDYPQNGGSGTFQTYVPPLLINHYYYKNTARLVYRSNFTAAQWTAMLKNELENGRPVQYAGYGDGGGHSFVCDGFNAQGYFHFNWGWGGNSDGYFMLYALNPGSLGTGGGTGGFNQGQQAVIGIEPNVTNPDPTPDPEVDYCASKANYTCATYISEVNFAGISNATTGCGLGYNYFSDKVGVVDQDGSYTIYLKPGFSGNAYTMYWTVWIDYNGNNIFDEDEVAVRGTSSNANTQSATIKIPANAKVGKTRMRVSMKWGGYAQPCETFNYGEVEDYDINIRPKSVTPPTPDPVDPNPVVSYCVSRATSSTSTYIKQVKVSDLNNSSGGSSTGYQHFSTTATLYGGNNYTMSLTPGFSSGSYTEYWRVWIDFDGNGKFEDAECVISGNSYGVSPLVRTIYIPSTAKKGQTRMRVSMKWGAYPTACETFYYGEVEDYTLNVN